MKILNLKIKNESSVIRSIDFLPKDIFFIYGNVEMPDVKEKTSNSIGKTLALMLVDYILGRKFDTVYAKKVIANYTIQAEVLHKEKQYLVEREINNNTVSVDGKSMKLGEYQTMFEIERKYISRQVRLSPKGSLLGYEKTIKQNDYVEFLEMLNLTEISSVVDEYYEIRTSISNLERTKAELSSIIGISDEKISEQLFITEKKIEDITTKIDSNTAVIKSLEIAEDTATLQQKYEQLNNDLKNVQIDIAKLTAEKQNLNSFIEKNREAKATTDSIKKMYGECSYQVPGMIYNSIENTEKFYRSVIEDRLKKINIRLGEISNQLSLNLTLKKQYIDDLDSIGRMISDNGVYQSAINMLNENNKIKSNLMFEHGKLIQIKEIDNKHDDLLSSISKKHTTLKNITLEYSPKINEYREFIYHVVRDIYGQGVDAYFDIYSKDYRKKAIPIHVDLNITGETGEGINEVKKNIIDILLFKYSKSDILLLDSSCFNGIDPRQVAGLISVIQKICVDYNKQAIISINKYQLDTNYLENINSTNSLTLSENEKLLKFDF